MNRRQVAANTREENHDQPESTVFSRRLRLQWSPCPELRLCAYGAGRSPNRPRLLLRRQLPLWSELRLLDGQLRLRLLSLTM